MTCKRAFRPTALEGRERLESRVVMSHAGLAHQVVPHFHGVAHHQHVVHGVTRSHKKVVGHGPKANPGQGSTAQSTPTTPVIVVPIQNPPVANPPVANPPVANPPVSPPPATSPLAVPIVSGTMSAQESTVVDLVNQQRAQAGLAPLQIDSRLVEAAQIHSKDMATLGQMEHTLPGAALPALQDRASYVGYNYSYMGENIAFNYPDDNSVMTAWMNSPGHRANILNANYTQIGVGIAFDGSGEPYYTQEFGNPA